MQENQKIENLKSKNEKGEEVSFQDLMGAKGLILYFYPKDNTHGCITQACNFRDYNTKFADLGYKIVGISKDSEKSHQKFVEKQQLNFPYWYMKNKKFVNILMCGRKKKFMGKKFMGIVRTTFIINCNLEVTKIYENVKVVNHIETVLTDLTKQ